jgi:hypothetical protein
MIIFVQENINKMNKTNTVPKSQKEAKMDTSIISGEV